MFNLAKKNIYSFYSDFVVNLKGVERYRFINLLHLTGQLIGLTPRCDIRMLEHSQSTITSTPKL